MHHLPIRTIPLSRLNPAPYNPRKALKPGDPEFEKLARSYDEFGLVEPLVWNKRTGHLVGGHQRLAVLKHRGETHARVSVVDLPPDREKALNLALNKIQGSWDEEKLAVLLRELTAEPDFDIEMTGFDADEVRDIIADVLGGLEAGRAENFDVEAALRAAGPPVTRPGEILELGPHRLLCGDSTDAAQVRRLMAGERAVLFATDPPYCVGYDGTTHFTTGGGKKRGRRRRIKPGRVVHGGKDWSGTYGTTWDDAEANPELYRGFIKAAIDEAISPNAAWYCWHASARQAMLEQIWTEHGAFVHCQIVWAKGRGILGRAWFLWAHEPCFMGWIKGNRPPRRTSKRLPTVWQIDTIPNGPERPDHPTPKPLELFEIPMLQHTRPGEICYEPFAGSGTQLIAAERLGRRCFAVEISPVYVDLCVRRYIAAAGESAVSPKLAKRYRLPRSGKGAA